MDLKQVLLDSVKKNVNVPGLCNDLLDGALEPALKSAIEKSDTKIDDIVFAALYPTLEVELKKIIAENWSKLLSPAPAGEGEVVSSEDVLGSGPVV